jgi:5-formyltetrahydrofolate cyclo-ligase
VFDEKDLLRARCRARRRLGALEAPADTAARLAERFLEAVPVPARAVMSGYWPFADEADPRPLMEALHARGHPLCLPVVAARGEPLVFRAWAPGEALMKSVFDTCVPPPERGEREPGCLLVPMLAFDRTGTRLGHGGGFYDRTLAALSQQAPLAVGLAFSFQEVEAVPRAPHDRRLDWIVTEREAIRIG